MKKQNPGGLRNKGGRPPIPADQRKQSFTFRASHENLEFLNALPPGTRSEFLNLLLDRERKQSRMASVIMKFKDAPIGARFNFIGDNVPKDVYVKINAHGDGLVVRWNGNVQGHQSHCCWLDEENGFDFDTEIEVL